MPAEQIAKEAFRRVRMTYKASYKSSNKWYFDKSGVMMPTARRAGESISHDDLAAHFSAQGQEAFAADGVGKQEAVEWSVMDQVFRVGNCQELSSLVLHQIKLLGGRGTTASLDPSDHIFTLVGQKTDTNKLHKVKVADLEDPKKPYGTLDVWVADPWLGVCCQAAAYPEMVRSQLKKWLDRGKRIFWVAPGDDDTSWTPPMGPNGASETYDSVFLGSTIAVGDISYAAWT